MMTPSELFNLESKAFIDLLQFAIVSIQPEPIFVHCVREYRLRPTAVAAVAIFDQFCDAHAPFRLRCPELLPPYELTLGRRIAVMRAAVEQSRLPPTPSPVEGEAPVPPPPAPFPPGSLFQAIESALLSNSEGALAQLAESYNPAVGPLENLPGGRMNPAQRTFVNQVWLPRVRPVLVTAGFWRLASLGQP